MVHIEQFRRRWGFPVLFHSYRLIQIASQISNSNDEIVVNIECMAK